MPKSRPLESFRIFPYLAWGLVLGFAFFVYTLTIELKSTQSEFATRASMMEARAQQDPTTLTDFTP